MYGKGKTTMRRVAIVFRSLAFLGLGLGFLAATSAQAVPLSLQIFADGVLIGDIDQTRLGCVDNPDGVSANCSVQDLVYGDEYPLLNIDNIDLHIDSDPVVTGTTGVTNLFSTTQQITLLFTLPITSIPGNTLRGGSIQGTATDNNGNGVTLSTVSGSALYTALVDGADTSSLYPDPFSTSAGNFGSASIPADEFGAPIPSDPGGPALNSIGIRLDFLLTPFDSASITSNFVVVVPEPGTAALLALGLVLVAAKRRRLS